MTYARTKAHDSKLGFYIHAAVFAAVLPALIALSLYLGGYFWAGWPALTWTIGLAAHAIWGVRWTPARVKVAA